MWIWVQMKLRKLSGLVSEQFIYIEIIAKWMEDKMINAWELFNVLKEYNYEQLKDLNIVIEIDREDNSSVGESRYAKGIEEYPSQIRIYSYW